MAKNPPPLTRATNGDAASATLEKTLGRARRATAPRPRERRPPPTAPFPTQVAPSARLWLDTRLRATAELR